MSNERSWDRDDIERKGDDFQIFPDTETSNESEDVEESEDTQQDQSDEEGQ